MALSGAEKVIIKNVFGQRYIGTRLPSQKHIEIEIFGIPGNNLGALLNGHRIIVHGNAQDGVGNTMDEGEIIIHGHAGDIVSMSMRGGAIYVRNSVGYRVGIHMKGYDVKQPVIVIGDTAEDFLGEYMAGGIIILLGLNTREHKMRFIGSGMHGGVIYIRNGVKEDRLSKHVVARDVNEKDLLTMRTYVEKFSKAFNIPLTRIMDSKFVKLVPVGKRPFHVLYALKR